MPNRFHGCDPRVFDSCHPRPVLGIDEVGTGCIAGPVYAAGVVLPNTKEVLEALIDSGLRDSKLMTPAVRDRVNDILMDHMVFAHIAFREAQDIETHGLSVCLDSMYHEIISTYRNQNGPPGCVLLDGNHRSSLSYTHDGIIHGDQKSLTISAASVIAKVSRDRFMVELSRTVPGYGFEDHKGYQTATHLAALKELGVSEVHRKSTKTIRRLLNPVSPPAFEAPCTARLGDSWPGARRDVPRQRGRRHGRRPFGSDA
jgi:ribonuclease HII